MSAEPSLPEKTETPPLMVQQAVFSSAATDRGPGYQFLGWSPGVEPALRQQLHPWAPTHDSLSQPPPQGAALSYFPLDHYCVIGWSSYAGQEYSGRGAAVFTHFLLVPRAGFEQAGAHPFALLQAALGRQILAPRLPVPETLPELQLQLRPTWVELELLLHLRKTDPQRWLAAALAALAAGRAVAIQTGEVSPHLLARGLWSCLPLSLRKEVSFTTGLVPSLRRPFRLTLWESWPWSAARLRRQLKALLIDLQRGTAHSAEEPPPPWIAKLVEAVSQGSTAGLLELLARLNRSPNQNPPAVSPPDTPAPPVPDQLHC